MFDKRISLGNVITAVTIIVGLAVQYGAWNQWAGAIEKRVEKLERDNRMEQVMQQLATLQTQQGVMQNSLLWLRTDVTDIKAQLSRKGAQ